jgi:hypothetical protein
MFPRGARRRALVDGTFTCDAQRFSDSAARGRHLAHGSEEALNRLRTLPVLFVKASGNYLPVSRSLIQVCDSGRDTPTPPISSHVGTEMTGLARLRLETVRGNDLIGVLDGRTFNPAGDGTAVWPVRAA